MNDKVGIVVCSRTDSKRCPNKPFVRIDGKYLICHLIDRLQATGITAYIAVPDDELYLYEKRLADYINKRTLFLFGGSKHDPLKRTFQVAHNYNLDHIIRVTHDKIFINYKQVDHFLSHYREKKLDYIYSTNFIPGMGFEVFSMACLRRAHQTFKDVEHLSYAVESVAKDTLNIMHFPFSRTWLNRLKPNSGLRLLIDYPKDVTAIDELMVTLQNARKPIEILDIVEGIENKPQPNSVPEVTVYTCSYNDAEFLDRCIHSVLSQSFHRVEYLLINDGSSNPVVHKTMRKYAKDPRVRVVRNEKNIGLSSSSNVANDLGRGRYVIRLDADDHFVDEKVIERMVRHMEVNNTDILYPHNYKDGRVQNGCEQHHVGGTMFKKRTLDYIRFTDGLRHYEGLDLYQRALLKGARIDYFGEPTFYYRQRASSMSKDKSEARASIGEAIERGVLGKELMKEHG